MPGNAVAFAACVRWIDLVALAGVAGGLALDAVVLPASVACDAPARRSLARWTTRALVVLAGASLAEIVVRAHTMAGGDARAALAATPLVLRATHFGHVWCLRAAGLTALLLLRPLRTRAGAGIALAIALGVALTTALTGHAADGGDATAAVAVDWLHVAAASVWTGGLFGLVLAVLPAALAAPDASWIDETVRRFSRLAAVSAVLVLASGAFNAWTNIDTFAALWTSAYGRVLAAKLALVAATLGIAAVNRYRVLPSFVSAGDDARIDGTEARCAAVVLATWVAREVALVLLVFGCTALLGQLPPPHHEHASDHAMHARATASSAARRTARFHIAVVATSRGRM